MPTQDIGAIIRFHRKQAGLTQNQLADLAGIGKTAVFDVEKNKASVRLDTLMHILNALNIDFSLDSPVMKIYVEQTPTTIPNPQTTKHAKRMR